MNLSSRLKGSQYICILMIPIWERKLRKTMKSAYLRAGLRLTILTTLVFAAVALVQPPKALAIDCFLQCGLDRTACNAACNSGQGEPDPNCIQSCSDDYAVCIAGC